jgi:predicted nuclease with TOPRIM domain
LTSEKAEQLDAIIKEISGEKSELEETYFKLRTEYLTTMFRMDEA